MQILEQMNINDKIVVLRKLEEYYGLADAANRQLNGFVSAFKSFDETVIKSRKNDRLKKIGILFFSATPIYAILMMFGFGFLSLFVEDFGFENKGVGVVLILVSLALALGMFILYRFIFKYFTSKTKEKQAEIVRIKSAVYGYIPYYEKIINENKSNALQLMNTYTIHPDFNHLEIVSFVITQLKSNPNIPLAQAVEYYHNMRHRESMLNEAQKQNTLIQQIQKENREFYDKALDKMDENNQINREILSSINYYRY